MSVQINLDPAWKRIEEAAQGALRESLLLLEREVVLEIERDNLQVSGDLKNSIVSDVDIKTLTATLGSNQKHAIYVHEGTKPHWAPLNAIRTWVVMKTGLKGDEADKRAKQVWLGIAKKGTKPHPFFTRAIEKWQHKLPRIMRDFMAKRL